jgi:hypothetical protein
MSTASDWHRRRQEEWDERHRRWAKELREREEREGTDFWKATQPKTQSFFDWSESERAAEAALRAEDLRKAAEEVRRGREELNRLLEDYVAKMGGSGSIPALSGHAWPGPRRRPGAGEVELSQAGPDPSPGQGRGAGGVPADQAGLRPGVGLPETETEGVASPSVRLLKPFGGRLRSPQIEPGRLAWR